MSENESVTIDRNRAANRNRHSEGDCEHDRNQQERTHEF